jgi:hypothetical protein
VQAVAIVLLCVLSAVTYGIVHDQITARLCVEYFTIGHPPVFHTDSPTRLAIGWGIIATWWVGAMLGVPLACAARMGRTNRRSAGSLVRPAAILLGVMAVSAVLAGLVGHVLASRGVVVLFEPLASRVPGAKHVAFLTALFAHNASYLIGFVGGIVLIVRVIVQRRSAVDAASDTASNTPWTARPRM